MRKGQTIIEEFQNECLRCGRRADAFKKAFDESRAPLHIFSRKKRILDANSPLSKLSQFTRQELMGMTIDRLFPKTSDHSDLLASEQLTSDSPLFTFSTRMLTKHKGQIPVEIAVSPLPRTPEANPVFQAHVRALSPGKPPGIHNDHTKDRLRSIGALAGGIAHNFNNIMTGLYGNITLARMELTDEAEALHYLEKAEDSMEEAVKLTRQLLTFSKGGDPIKENFHPLSLIKEVAQFNLSGSAIRLEISPKHNTWQINGDQNQIGQVVSSIVMNARQSMTEGGTLSISLENTSLLKDNLLTIARGAYIKISFKDQGCGISQSNLPRIFDPYFTTKKDGGGMGLAISYSIVAKHKGHISASSQLGTGTIITVYLPAVQENHPKEEPMTSEHINPPPQTRILVMDDEAHIRTITKKMLEKFGYNVSLTQDGQEAVSAYEEAMKSGTPFKLVIMDLTIPGGMGGQEASKHILDMDPDAAIVVSSGYSNDQVMADYKAYGLKGIIPKPFRLAELKEMVAKLVS